MKARDGDKLREQKIQLTVTMTKFIAELLEDRARKMQTTPSKVIEALCQRYIATDEDFYTEMAKFHAGKMHEYLFLKEQTLATKEVVENNGR
jgi:hypothetical protein